MLPRTYGRKATTRSLGTRTMDKLEDRLHALTCAVRLWLEQARREIAADWIAAYRKYVGAAVLARGTARLARS